MKLVWVLCCLFVLTACQTGLKGGVYTVRASDTVYSISKKFNVPMQKIISRNGLRPPYRLSINQKLVIPTESTHTVRKGETIYSISQKYKVGFKTLAAYNGIRSPWTVRVGQKLKIPTQGGGTSWISTPTAVSTAKAPTPAVKPTKSTKVAAPKTPLNVPKRTGKFTWPVSGHVIASFGASGSGQRNDGINISAPKGTTVKAADNGVVAYAGNEIKGFGNLLLLKHENNWVTAYAHNDSLLVKRGDTVKQGQAIAKVGTTGNVNKPQLHFEIRKDSRAVDPSLYMK